MNELWNDFKKFIMRGNVLDLAVAVIIGLAFNAVVQSFVGDVIMPFIGAIFGEPSFDELTFDVGDGVVRYGAFLTAVVDFLIIASAVFLIVKAFEQLQKMRKAGVEEVDERSDEVVLLTEIRDLLRTRT